MCSNPVCLKPLTQNCDNPCEKTCLLEEKSVTFTTIFMFVHMATVNIARHHLAGGTGAVMLGYACGGAVPRRPLAGKLYSSKVLVTKQCLNARRSPIVVSHLCRHES